MACAIGPGIDTSAMRLALLGLALVPVPCRAEDIDTELGLAYSPKEICALMSVGSGGKALVRSTYQWARYVHLCHAICPPSTGHHTRVLQGRVHGHQSGPALSPKETMWHLPSALVTTPWPCRSFSLYSPSYLSPVEQSA